MKGTISLEQKKYGTDIVLSVSHETRERLLEMFKKVKESGFTNLDILFDVEGVD